MLNRRSFLGGLCASLPIIAPPGSSSARTARPRLHAMIVGIDTYPGLGRRNQLRGCINDARDIARAVRPLAATIRMLGFTAASGVEQAVDRDFFFSTWQAMAAEARDGDTLLLTFSGHGGQVPDLNGDEADGKDETLILSAFNTGPPGSVTQHIVDDELAVLFAGAHARRLAVVFVADCCYSGTVYRRVELDDVRHRTIRSYQPLPDARSVVTRQLGASESPPNLVFLGASQEDEAAPEINIDGEWRGALSVAVAQALRGGAVRDGVITGYSLTRSVLRTVNALSDSGQHPTVIWGGPRARPADTMTLDPRRPLIVLGPAPAPPAVSAATDGPVRLRIRGLAAGERPPLLTNALVVGEAEPASLIWDAGRRLVFNDRGNRIAEGVDARQLQHAVDRQRALESIIRMSAGDGLNVEVLLPGQTAPTVTSDATHTPGTMLTIRIGRVEDGRNSGCIETGHYFAVFNVTGSGKVQMLWPTPYRQPDPRHANFAGPDFTDGRRKAGSDPERIGHVQVRQPFGADHVVAVAGALPLGRLMPALVEGHEQFGSLRAIEALALEARAQPLQVGFKGIYTSRGRGRAATDLCRGCEAFTISEPEKSILERLEGSYSAKRFLGYPPTAPVAEAKKPLPRVTGNGPLEATHTPASDVGCSPPTTRSTLPRDVSSSLPRARQRRRPSTAHIALCSRCRDRTPEGRVGRFSAARGRLCSAQANKDIAANANTAWRKEETQWLASPSTDNPKTSMSLPTPRCCG